MDKLQSVGKWLAFFVISFLIMPKCAYAYMDPGTGSFILQAIVAFALGALVIIKQFWRKIIGFFKRK